MLVFASVGLGAHLMAFLVRCVDRELLVPSLVTIFVGATGSLPKYVFFQSHDREVVFIRKQWLSEESFISSIGVCVSFVGLGTHLVAFLVLRVDRELLVSSPVAIFVGATGSRRRASPAERSRRQRRTPTRAGATPRDAQRGENCGNGNLFVSRKGLRGT